MKTKNINENHIYHIQSHHRDQFRQHNEGETSATYQQTLIEHLSRLKRNKNKQ